MKIVNETNLCYAELGLLIDNIIKSNTGNTMYYGKVERTIVEFGSHKIYVQIRYSKRYVEWRFYEKENN
jgi:hypothetical protein